MGRVTQPRGLPIGKNDYAGCCKVMNRSNLIHIRPALYNSTKEAIADGYQGIT